MKKFVVSVLSAFAVIMFAVSAHATNVVDTGNGGEGVVGGAVGDAVDGVTEFFDDAGNNGGEYAATDEDGDVADNDVDGMTNDRFGVAGGIGTAPLPDRNPTTSAAFGMVELAAIGTTMLGTAALAGRRRK